MPRRYLIDGHSRHGILRSHRGGTEDAEGRGREKDFLYLEKDSDCFKGPGAIPIGVKMGWRSPAFDF